MKATADKHRKELDLNVGDMVYIKLQQYWQHSVLGGLVTRYILSFLDLFKLWRKSAK